MMNQLILMVKKNYKTTLYVLLGFAVMYGMIYIFTPKPQMPTNLKATIDSLTKVNEQLIKHQQQIDSTIGSINSNVSEVDLKISNIKEKTTIIREYYHEQATAASKFTPSQVDSFLKARYKY